MTLKRANDSPEEAQEEKRIKLDDEIEQDLLLKKKKKSKKNKKKKQKKHHPRNKVDEYHDQHEDDPFYESGEQHNQPDEPSEEYELLMHTKDTLPPSIRRFWWRRYDLFSRFDEGIYMSEELWYSVTPEAIAKYIAELFYYLIPDATSCLDICCGGGGNTIQFAELFPMVGAIDNNKTSLYCTEHNVGVYGLRDKVWTLQADWNEISGGCDLGAVNVDWIPLDLRKSEPNKSFDFIFASPPWGGTFYDRGDYDLYNMEYFPIVQFLRQCKQYTGNIGLYLPRSLNLDQLSQATYEVFGPKAKCRAMYLNHNGRTVALLALFGELFTSRIDELDDVDGEVGEEADDNC